MLSFRLKKQTSKNVVDTTYKNKIKTWKAEYSSNQNWREKTALQHKTIKINKLIQLKMLNITLKLFTIKCCWNNVHASINETDKLLISTDRRKQFTWSPNKIIAGLPSNIYFMYLAYGHWQVYPRFYINI